MEQTEEDEISLISFEEVPVLKELEIKNDFLSKNNKNLSAKPAPESDESFKSLLRKESPKIQTCVDESSLLKIEECKVKSDKLYKIGPRFPILMKESDLEAKN